MGELISFNNLLCKLFDAVLCIERNFFWCQVRLYKNVNRLFHSQEYNRGTKWCACYVLKGGNRIILTKFQ